MNSNIPIFFRSDEKPLHIRNLYYGQSVFFMFSGPSLKDYDLSLFRHPGIMTFGVNNSPFVFRPDFHCMVDDVSNFAASIYRDPKIMNFIPYPKNTEKIFDNNAWKYMDLTLKHCPNVVYYKRGAAEVEYFRTDTFFEQSVINWGNFGCRCHCGYMKEEDDPKLCPKCGHDNRWGKRTVFLAALRIAYELGFRKIYLCGTDFKMKSTQDNYAFHQSRSSGSVKNNNKTYSMLNLRMEALKPEIEKRGLEVINCTEGSGLKTFPFMDYREAIYETVKWMPVREQSEGLYDRKAKEKDAKKREQPKPEQPEQNDDTKPITRWLGPGCELLHGYESSSVSTRPKKITTLKDFAGE